MHTPHVWEVQGMSIEESGMPWLSRAAQKNHISNPTAIPQQHRLTFELRRSRPYVPANTWH